MEEQRAPGTVGIATKYGLIQGVLSVAVFFVATLTSLRRSWVDPAVTTALLIVLMVLAHREFKRTHNRVMTYPQGLGSGTLLAAVAVAIRAVVVYVYLKYINPGFIATMLHAQQQALQQRGITGAQAQQAMAITSAIMTPAGIVIASLVTGVIGGFLVALIVSIFTQKSDPRAVI